MLALTIKDDADSGTDTTYILFMAVLWHVLGALPPEEFTKDMENIFDHAMRVLHDRLEDYGIEHINITFAEDELRKKA